MQGTSKIHVILALSKEQKSSRTLTIRETGIGGKHIMTLTSKIDDRGGSALKRRVMDNSIRGT